MDLLKPIKDTIKKVRDYMDTVEQERQEQEKLERWKKRLTDAISKHDSFRANCAMWDAQYNGTKTVASIGTTPMSNRTPDQSATKDARQVINLNFQLIESQIDISVPKPNVEPTEFDNDDQTESERNTMIEGMLTYMGSRPALERIVSENERIAKKNSLCLYKVGYNPNFKAHKYIGTIETTNPHPANVIPQPGVFRIKDMDYLFHIENRTLDYICRTYGEEWREVLEGEGTEYPNIDDLSASKTTNTDNKNGEFSIVEVWHKDKDADVCLITWINDHVVRELPKFFYKRDAEGNLIEFDEIEIGTDEMGQPIIARVPVHVPKQFPFVVQYNVPKEKSYYGIADGHIISDQQESIKKVMSAREEQIINGTTKVVVRKGSGLESKINNAQMQILVTEDPVTDVVVKDLKTPDQSSTEWYGLMQQAAKDALGITEASQGRVDTGATGGKADLSGRALEILSANTQGRLGTKAFEKNIAFTELYQLYYDFVLAFYDDKRPYRIDGDDGKPMYGYFDKAKLIKQDDAGEWYYPEYDIHITADTGLPKDKNFIMNAANNAGDRMDNISFWTVMESIGFPNASAILKREQEKEAAANTPPDPIQQYLLTLSPEDQQAFLSLPQEQQLAMVQSMNTPPTM